MNTWERTRFIFAVIAQILAAVCVAVAAYFAIAYFIDVEASLRYEYVTGAWLGLTYATGLSLGCALLASTLKKAVPKRMFQFLIIPGLLIGATMLMFYFGGLAYDLFSRT